MLAGLHEGEVQGGAGKHRTTAPATAQPRATGRVIIGNVPSALIVVLVAGFTFGWIVLLADEYKQRGKHVAAGAAFISNLALWNESGYFTMLQKPSRCCILGA
jgi:hypothetical protein